MVSCTVLLVGDAGSALDSAKRVALATATNDVRVVLITPGRERAESSMGEVRVVRVPVELPGELPGVFQRSGRNLTLGLARGYDQSDDKQLSKESAGKFAGVSTAGDSHFRRQIERIQSAARRRLNRYAGQVSDALHLGVGATIGRRSWRAVVAEADAFDRTFGPTIDALRPNEIHVFDAEMLLAAVRAAGRAKFFGREIRVTYRARGRRQVAAAAWASLESRLVEQVDRIVENSDAAFESTALVDGASRGWTPELAERSAVDPRFEAGADVVLGIGPVNSAGQGWAWAHAAATNLSGVGHHVLMIENGRFTYRADTVVSPRVFREAATWSRSTSDAALATWTHAMFESGRPLFGDLRGVDFRGDADLLGAAGIRVGMVFHGSEVRDPRSHAERHEFSPFRNPREDLTRRLQRRVDSLASKVAVVDYPLFVSTYDLLEYVPRAVWLPVTVDLNSFPAARTLWSGKRPVIVHAPSSTILKGTDAVEAVMQPLVDLGIIEYRRLSGSPHDVLAGIADADIVIDQLLLGGYGVFACEALAMGRVVVGGIGPRLEAAFPEPIPVLDANPDTLASVVARILDDRIRAVESAASGPPFVLKWHDGSAAARVLAPFLGR
ncbi:MAG: hypothetical protein WCJ42_09495 [Actinomycetes bacterium]